MQTASEPVCIARGEGAYLYDEAGKKYIDAVASWWTNIHGHSHPHIAKAIAQQASQLEHVIFAGFTHKPAQQLAGKLLQYIPFHHKVFYSDNGSTAVEAAIKMALQYWWNKGIKRTKVIAFRDAYHGDTFGSMSVSARGVFNAPFNKLLFDVEFIDTPNFENEDEVVMQFGNLLSEKGEQIAAFIFEPLVLGSAGMKMYSEAVLDKLMLLCKQQNILCIADEVMTGFGRTGKFLATDYCKQKPDIICLSKGITGGFLPFAATTATDSIYNVFLSDEKSKMFFHGHSYTGNPLGCAAALASLEVFEAETTFEKIQSIANQHLEFLDEVRNHISVNDIRCKGTILAIELKTNDSTGYLNQIRDKAYNYFMERKIIMRPLGNVIYVLPPYCISKEDLRFIYDSIKDFLNQHIG
jgi:adenosylmethionine-8-amino-7-oxononanoate aminotransferase